MSEDQKQNRAPMLRETIDRIAERQNQEIRERNKQNAEKANSSKKTTATVSKDNAEDHGLSEEQRRACDKVGLPYSSFARAAGAVEAEDAKASSNVEMSEQEKEICNRMGIDHDLYRQVSAQIEAEGRGPLTSTPKSNSKGADDER